MVVKSSAAAESFAAATRNQKYAWRGGIIRRLPWKGLLALGGALACILAAIAVLAYSDGKAIESWKYSPSVYVSIAYTLANVLLENAFARGIVISWWRKAIRDGTTVGDLHRYWDFGGTWGALMSGRHFNFIAFACLFLSIAPITGPLLQRSSEVELRSTQSSRRVNVQIASSIDAPTGYMVGPLQVVPLLTELFTSIFQDHQNGESIPVGQSGCNGDGKCYGHVSGAGFTVECSSYTVPSHLAIPPGCDLNEFYYGNPSQECSEAIVGSRVFLSNTTWAHAQPGEFKLNMQYKEGSDCNSDLMVKNCTLRAATVQYPIVIDGNSSTISLDPSSTMFDDIVERTINYTDPGTQAPTQLGGFAKALHEMFYGQAIMQWSGTTGPNQVGYDLLTAFPAGSQFANLSTVLAMPGEMTENLCNVFFNDPLPYFLEQTRQLMFRTALITSNSDQQQTATMREERVTGVFRSDYAYLGAAAGISLLAIMITLATYHGYWLLGRRVTMSPIEIAKAFDAPILSTEHPNSEVDELVKDIGKKPVQYGIASNLSTGQNDTLQEPELYWGTKSVGNVNVQRAVPDVSGMGLAMASPGQVDALLSR